MKTSRRALLVASAAFALAAVGAAPVAAQELPVAIFNATTGAFAFGGVPIQNGMRLALEQANQTRMLGAAKIKIIEGDDAADKAQSINLVNQFGRRDKALLIMGPTNSFSAIGAGPLVNEMQVPMLAVGSSNAILATGPWAFKIQAQGADIMKYLSKYISEKSGMKRVALIYDQGSDGIIEQKDAFRDGLKAAGVVTVVSEDGIAASESNFLALGTKLAGQNLDGIFLAAPAEQIANMAIQFRQAGLDPKVRFMGPSTLASLNFIKIGGKAVEGTLIIADYNAASTSPLNIAFANAYKARYKIAPDNWAAMGYTIGQVGLLAIKNAGPNPDRAKVRAELEKINNVPVVIGNGMWTKNEARHPFYGGVILTIKNGEFVPIQ